MKKKFKIAFGVLLSLFILIFGVSCCVMAIADAPVNKNYFNGETNPYIAKTTAMVSAHRAGSLLAPENTLNAFKLGIEEATAGGYTVDIWEFDLHITKDGKLILLHDATLNRTSNATEVLGDKKAKPEDYTLEEIRRLNMGYNFELNGVYPFRDLTETEIDRQLLRVCTLEEVLTYLSTDEAKAAAPDEFGKFRYIIEIKDKGKKGKQAADIMYSTLQRFGILEDVIYGTFNQGVSSYTDKKYPDLLRSASICEVLDFYFAYLTNADLSKRSVGYCALQIPFTKSIRFLGKKDLIEYAHKYNIAVQYWTVNDENDIAFLQSIGADCVMSDRPDTCYAVLKGDTDAPNRLSFSPQWATA